MTLAVDKSTLMGALYSAVKQYPGGVRQMARDMDMPESTLYAKLRGERGYPLDCASELDDLLNFLRSRGVVGFSRVIQVFCHQHDHLCIPVPRVMRVGSPDGLMHVSEMMQEVADIAQALSAGVDESGDAGSAISERELKRIEQECDEAMERIAETRECYRAQYRAAKKKGVL